MYIYIYISLSLSHSLSLSLSHPASDSSSLALASEKETKMNPERPPSVLNAFRESRRSWQNSWDNLDKSFSLSFQGGKESFDPHLFMW